jgi:hypothetical protein
MGLENVSVVDAVGTEPTSGCVVLSIIDSWDWSDEHSHLLALRDKLNSYSGFVEGVRCTKRIRLQKESRCGSTWLAGIRCGQSP